jgi:hypothetical protein
MPTASPMRMPSRRELASESPLDSERVPSIPADNGLLIAHQSLIECPPRGPRQLLREQRIAKNDSGLFAVVNGHLAAGIDAATGKPPVLAHGVE